jgi:hypothetical protein
MAMTGYGRATKAQIQEMVRVQLGLKQKPKPMTARMRLLARSRTSRPFVYNKYMIVRVRGTIIEHDNDMVVVDCNGIGYGVHVCFDEQQRLSSDTSCDLFIAEMIKEDAHELFGFSQKSRKQLFDLLTSVNGIGPKAAMRY